MRVRFFGLETRVAPNLLYWQAMDREEAMPSAAETGTQASATDGTDSALDATDTTDMLRGKTILYVEDNLANVALMRELCSMDEVELVVAGTAELGLELARSNPPDLIAMDINLPGLSGLQALKALRADPVTAAIPVMAVTAAAQPSDLEAGAGFDAYVTKPIQIELFLSTAERLIRSRR